MYAGFPPTLTLTLARMVGSLPLTMLLSQVSVVADKFVSWMVIQELGTIPAWKLASLEIVEIGRLLNICPPLVVKPKLVFVKKRMIPMGVLNWMDAPG